ncbi:MAG: hydroxyacylglutathione hydrolase [Bdellovibrionaceae bacterium]|nr:hydroxyacylglutathione hydrolase [Bdellovibrio sp.]
MIAGSSVEIIPILNDNYVFAILNAERTEALIVDPGDAAPVLKWIKEKNVKVVGILLTHHHNDHIGGALELKTRYDAAIYAPHKNKLQIRFADIYVSQGQTYKINSFHFEVDELPGHTLGHIAYWFKQEHWLFSGDVLFGLGCGRLFEGTPEQMYNSLQKIKNLPIDTKVFCTHEYTETNLKFCYQLKEQKDFKNYFNWDEVLQYETKLKARRQLKQPSVPLQLDIENKVNPFMRAGNIEQFTFIRNLRSTF